MSSPRLTYTCINDLELQAKWTPPSIYQELLRLRDKIDKAKQWGNDEFSYIYLREWQQLVEWLKKTTVRNDEINECAELITDDQINEVNNILADKKQRLEELYELQKFRKPKDTLGMPSNDIGFEFTTEDPLYKSLCNNSEEWISCDQLYFLIEKIGKRYLIIDTRQKAHYEKSMILSKSCINIPQTEIDELSVAWSPVGDSFVKRFPKDTIQRQLFLNKSANTDILVLVDWNAQETLMQPDVHIKLVKNIFEKWDPDVKHNIKILNGGYQEWLLRYPELTTNFNIHIPELNSVEYDPRCKEVFKFLKELNELAKSKKRFAKEGRFLENQLHVHREAFSAIEQEYLRGEIEFQKVKLEDTHKMYLKTENELETYSKKEDTIKFYGIERNEKKNLELNLFLLNTEIEDIETKWKNLQK